MTIQEVRELGDTELLVELHRAASQVSFHEACDDGEQYRREHLERQIAKSHFNEVHVQAIKRGLKFELKGYLL